MKQQFAGATGYITSNFTLSDAADVTDHQFAVIFVKLGSWQRVEKGSLIG